MNYITTTELRTKSSQLIVSLKKGEQVTLIHRSKIVGIVTPEKESRKVFSAKRAKKILDKLNLTPIPIEKREAIYRKHLMKKYGQGLS